jgi:hypothetical protein
VPRQGRSEATTEKQVGKSHNSSVRTRIEIVGRKLPSKLVPMERSNPTAPPKSPKSGTRSRPFVRFAPARTNGLPDEDLAIPPREPGENS